MFAVWTYARHGWRPVIVTDLRENRVAIFSDAVAPLSTSVVTLVAADDVLAERVAWREAGFTDVENAVEWNRRLMAAPVTPEEIRADTTNVDVESTVRQILVALGRSSA